MIIKSACPNTGVTNFFVSADPLIAVGCIGRAKHKHYVWHCHMDDEISGTAADFLTAEIFLRRAIASRREETKAAA